MKFQLPLLAVRDVARSKQFYKELFDQEVVLDLGKNVTFSGGFAIQEDFAWLTGLAPDRVLQKSNNMELYFEAEDFDAFLLHLRQYPEVEQLHHPKMYDWKQRVVRLYDPDGHLVEIGESMCVIARRYLAEGKSALEVSELIQHPLAFVEACR